MKNIELRAEFSDKILNVISKQLPEISFSYANKLLRQKDIKLNGKRINENVLVNCDDLINVYVSETVFSDKKQTLNVVYQDEILAIVFKPKGIEVTGDVVNFQNNVKKFLNNNSLSALNRLDRNTEGLVIFANGNENLKLLKTAMKNGEILKVYMAEVVGKPKWNNLDATNKLSFKR